MYCNQATNIPYCFNPLKLISFGVISISAAVNYKGYKKYNTSKQKQKKIIFVAPILAPNHCFARQKHTTSHTHNITKYIQKKYKTKLTVITMHPIIVVVFIIVSTHCIAAVHTSHMLLLLFLHANDKKLQDYCYFVGIIVIFIIVCTHCTYYHYHYC